MVNSAETGGSVLPDWMSGRMKRVCELLPASASVYTEPALCKKEFRKHFAESQIQNTF